VKRGAGYAESKRTPEIELLWWAGCPSTEPARAQLAEVLDELGLAAAEVRSTEIRTDADARSRRFVGSPTILIDGADVVPPETDEPAGLSCRVYRRRDGRISPTPDPDDLRDALRGALLREEATTR
jgi:hypothetical protein